MFRDFADRHGCRDLGLVRVLRAKVQPPEIPVFHVSPRSCQRSMSIFPTVFATMVDRTEAMSLPLILPIFWARRSQRVRRFAEIHNISSMIQMCVFSSNAT